MSHELQKASDMAYVGDTPWHQLGNKLAPKQPIEVWAKQAGMDFEILESPVRFITEQTVSLGAIQSFPDNKVLYRSDTKAPLSVVSNRYQTVQPREVLEFYRDLTEVSGYELETAGVLKGGKKFWALAKTGKSAAIKGNDLMHGYVLLATSCDGTLATTAQATSIRVVCNNTLAIALKNGTGAVKIPHSTLFDPRAVKEQLGIAVGSWDEFMYSMKKLSERKVKANEATAYLLRVFAEQPVPGGNGLPNERAINKVLAMFNGAGRGAELDSSKGTAFGLLNAVTEFTDHERKAKSDEYRLDSAWFGNGAQLKQKALDQAMLLAA
jgi:phage/plasmid-like protein (TIGR03299 family)